MACGTGKTFTSLRLIEQETGGKGLVLFLVPSIALLNQTLVAWCDDAAKPLHAVCVCSDAQANQRIKRGEDEPEEDPNALALPPTTRPDILAKRIRYLREKYPDALTVVFSTYQSIAVIEEAQRTYLGREHFAFDFAVCDEAHRTTGAIAKEEEEPAFTYIHDDAHVLARRRLYMTATPRLYAESAKAKAKERSIELCSMDDLALYGKEIYRIGFGTAVAKGCLADYKVLVLTLPEGELPEDSPYELLTDEERKALESRNDDGRTTAVKLLGCINALAKRLKDSPLLTTADGVPARRAVAFCRTIKTSKATTALFQKFAADPRFNTPLRVEARHVDGEMGALARNDALAWLKADGGPAVCHLLTNVRCLSEGVDVPSLDAVLFLSKRNSQIDVVQSVGRVMRTAPGKRYGYIVIPVVIPADKDPEKELDNSDTFGVVWTVLNALRAHDDRFEATINKLRFDKPSMGETLPGPNDPIDSAEPPAITISSGLSGDEEGVFPNTLAEPSAIQDSFDLRFPEKMEQYRNLLYGRIVKHCGNRKYFEHWAAEVAEIAKRLAETLQARCAADPRAADTFRRFHALLQTAVYSNVSEEDARVMLVQQRITGPIFDTLFGGNGFTDHNPVSQALDHATDLLAALDTEEDRKTLDRFYQDATTPSSPPPSRPPSRSSASSSPPSRSSTSSSAPPTAPSANTSASASPTKTSTSSTPSPAPAPSSPASSRKTSPSSATTTSTASTPKSSTPTRLSSSPTTSPPSTSKTSSTTAKAARRNTPPSPASSSATPSACARSNPTTFLTTRSSAPTPSASSPRTTPPSPSSSATHLTPLARNPPTTMPKTRTIRG